jgi:hypothetical protein
LLLFCCRFFQCCQWFLSLPSLFPVSSLWRPLTINKACQSRAMSFSTVHWTPHPTYFQC